LALSAVGKSARDPMIKRYAIFIDHH